MTYIHDLQKLSVVHGGPIERVLLYQKPLWFSDCMLAVSKSSKALGVAKFMRSRMDASQADNELPLDVLGGAASLGAGLAFDAQEAMIKALCEGVERYCGQIVDPKRHIFVTSSYDEMVSKGFDLPYWQDLSWKGDGHAPSMGVKKYNELTPFNRQASIRWLQVKKLPEMSLAYVPVVQCFLGLEFASVYERICEQMSTGMACGSSWIGAASSGIYEVIERDAIMGMWLTRRSPPRVLLKSLMHYTKRQSLKKICSEFLQTGYEIIISDLTNDVGVPVFFVTLLYNAPPFTIVGASCGIDADYVLEKALVEVLMGLSSDAIYKGLSLDSREAPSPAGEGAIRTMSGHAEFYAKNDCRERMAFLCAGKEIDYADSLAVRASLSMSSEASVLGEIGLLAKKLAQVGKTAYINDLTCDFASELSLHVVKAVVPGLLPLYNRESNKPEKMARLRDYATIYERKLDFGEEVNPWSHPFP